jgi:hypothetical protein
VTATSPPPSVRRGRSPEAVQAGQTIARALFAKRERGATRNAEIHIREADLAAALALAFEQGRASR